MKAVSKIAKVTSPLEYDKQGRKCRSLISAEYRYINSNKEECLEYKK